MTVTRLTTGLAAVVALWLAPSPVLAQFDTPNRAFHNATAFPLEGRHQAVACEACHLDDQYEATPNTCYACHWERRRDDPYLTSLGTQCEQCHRPVAWTAVTWDHAGQAGVPLNGDHRQLGCLACHQATSFAIPTVTCVNCHQRDFTATRTPNHAAAGFPASCESCHRPGDATWQSNGGLGFEHAAIFPLVGVHATQGCVSCHANDVYLGTSRDCVGCHQDDYARTTTPSHAAAGFPVTCDTCHRPTDPQWGGSSQFDHDAFFLLQGVHATQSCVACHVNNVFAGTPRDCIGCHQDDYSRTTTPSHAAAGFSTTCETCHRPTDPQWQGGGSFEHNAVFLLEGAHAVQDCASCHRNNVFAGTPRDCVGCHQDDYDRTSSPSHAPAGFPTSCESCHRPTQPWSGGGGFNHAVVFPLVGTHAAQACVACHANNVYGGTPRDCVGCHQDDYNRTASPNHASAGFSTTCEGCHRPTDPQWGGAGFDHNQVFTLVGRHASASCTACHVNNVFAGTPRDCVGCHLAAYNATRNPSHASTGFPTSCESCHRPTDANWDQGTFEHSWFPLRGDHNRPCAQCHTTPNNYTLFSCTGCHTRGDTDDEHDDVNGYRYESTACFSCHPDGRE